MREVHSFVRDFCYIRCGCVGIVNNNFDRLKESLCALSKRQNRPRSSTLIIYHTVTMTMTMSGHRRAQKLDECSALHLIHTRTAILNHNVERRLRLYDLCQSDGLRYERD